MRETLRAMKQSASTPEAKQAVKEFKEKMKAECKREKKEFKGDRKRAERLQAKHVADVTIPDDSELPADTQVTKTWKMKNTGTIAWPLGSQLLFVGRRDGDKVHGPEKAVVAEGPVMPSQEVNVSVTFVTPSEPGRYVCYYRMATPDGDKFGKKVQASFVIAAPGGMMQ
jgi:next-to-BRCA1 protein 1